MVQGHKQDPSGRGWMAMGKCSLHVLSPLKRLFLVPRSLRSASQWSPGCPQPPPWQKPENIFFLPSVGARPYCACCLSSLPMQGWSLVCGAVMPPSSPWCSVQPWEFWHGLRVQPGILCPAGTRAQTDAAGIKSAWTFPFPAFSELEILPWPHAETNYCHAQNFFKGQKVMKGQNYCVFCTIWYLYQYLWLTGTDWRTEFDVDCCRHGRQCIIKMNFSKCLNSLHV